MTKNQCKYVVVYLQGLMPAIYELVPEAKRRWCARHLNSNWRKKYRGKVLEKQLQSCVFLTSQADYKKKKDKMVELSQAAYISMLEHHPQFQCKAFFDRQSQCKLTDNNLYETFNGKIVPARTMNIYSCFEENRKYIMRSLLANRDMVNKQVSELGPSIRKKLLVKKKENWNVLLYGMDMKGMKQSAIKIPMW